METERLLERAQSGDVSAVDQLLRVHYGAVHSVCHRMLLSRESADDAVQNALIAIVKGLPRFDGKAALSTWIYRIATNSAIDEIRRVRRHGGTVPLNDAASAHTLASEHAVDPTALLAEHLVDSSRVAQALGTLPEEFRAVVVLRYISIMPILRLCLRFQLAPSGRAWPGGKSFLPRNWPTRQHFPLQTNQT